MVGNGVVDSAPGAVSLVLLGEEALQSMCVEDFTCQC